MDEIGLFEKKTVKKVNYNRFSLHFKLQKQNIMKNDIELFYHQFGNQYLMHKIKLLKETEDQDELFKKFFSK